MGFFPSIESLINRQTHDRSNQECSYVVVDGRNDGILDGSIQWRHSRSIDCVRFYKWTEERAVSLIRRDIN